MGQLLVIAAVVLAQAVPVHFLPDDAQVACRAILPQCFRRADWADLCENQPDLQLAHPEACQAALEH